MDAGIPRLSKRPSQTSFHQQRMCGWTPSFEAKFISKTFICGSIIYLIVGAVTIIVSSEIVDYSIEYTNCKNDRGQLCAELINQRVNTEVYYSCQCHLPFVFENRFKAPIYFYYVLGNYYQNHRKYMSSRDDDQLHGDDIRWLNSDCEPRRYHDNKSFAPCGLVANSKFNDTFQLLYNFENKTIPVNWTNENIAWNIDRNVKFGRPKNWTNTIKPENWKYTALEYNPGAYSGDEEFLVWMRTAPLYNFRKLHRVIYAGKEPFKMGLPKGSYTLVINYAYPVTLFKGYKFVFFTTTSFLGGKNINISIMFLLVSGIQFVVGIFLMYLDMYSTTSTRNSLRISSIRDS